MVTPTEKKAYLSSEKIHPAKRTGGIRFEKIILEKGKPARPNPGAREALIREGAPQRLAACQGRRERTRQSASAADRYHVDLARCAWLYRMTPSFRRVATPSGAYPSISIRTSVVFSPWAGANFLVDRGVRL